MNHLTSIKVLTVTILLSLAKPSTGVAQDYRQWVMENWDKVDKKEIIFKEAKEQDKLILLFVGRPTCPACQDMSELLCNPDNPFKKILDDIAGKIPGIDKISTEPMPDDRLLLKFNDKGFKDAFSAQQMSDGTLKLFAYLLLLSDPTPPPFFCIEEPENGLYHKLLETLVQQFRAHVTDGKNKSQIFVTTHQPYFVDALEPNEVWILEKGTDGFSKIRRASDDPVIGGLVDEGLPLGGLWYSDYLEGV